MPRRPRNATGGIVYHALNRAVGRATLFKRESDYLAFEQVLAEAHARIPVPILSYIAMPNHFHLELFPPEDGQLSEFMRWVTVTHTQRWHAAHRTAGTGPLYQGRFKSFPVETDRHVLLVARYIERNASRAKLVARAEQWRWSSLWHRVQASRGEKLPAWLTSTESWPVDVPGNWVELVNRPMREAEESAVVRSIVRGAPLGSEQWVKRIARKLSLESALRPRGRPRVRREKT